MAVAARVDVKCSTSQNRTERREEISFLPSLLDPAFAIPLHDLDQAPSSARAMK